MTVVFKGLTDTLPRHGWLFAVSIGVLTFVAAIYIAKALRMFGRRRSIDDESGEKTVSDSGDKTLRQMINDQGKTLSAAEDRLDHLREEVAALDKYTAELEMELSKIRRSVTRSIDDLRREFAQVFASSRDLISIDDKDLESFGRTPPIALTAIQMFEAIRATDSLVRREFARRYLAAYVSWDCWLHNRTVSDDNEISLLFMLFPPSSVESLYANFKHIQIGISTKVRRSPVVSNLADGAAVTVKGRIYQIALSVGFGGMAFILDDVEIRERRDPAQ